MTWNLKQPKLLKVEASAVGIGNFENQEEERWQEGPTLYTQKIPYVTSI